VRGKAFVLALGGAANLKSIDACTTRLRLVVVDQGKVDERALKALGAVGVIRPSDEGLQVVVGPIADSVAMEMRSAAGPLSSVVQEPAKVASVAPIIDARPWLDALGGRDNIVAAGAAASRVWLQLLDASRANEAALSKLGVRMIARPEPGSLHLLVGDAEPIAAALQPA
jgi:PTS system N-acetylglucosamine-specific IIC component